MPKQRCITGRSYVYIAGLVTFHVSDVTCTWTAHGYFEHRGLKSPYHFAAVGTNSPSSIVFTSLSRSPCDCAYAIAPPPPVRPPPTNHCSPQEVKAHFESLPPRYTLSVEPEDVLTHMSLVADAANSLAPVRVLVYPSCLPSRLHPSGGGGGAGGGDHARGRKRGRCTVLVVCRYSPRLLGAISSSLRSSGGERSIFCCLFLREDFFLAYVLPGGDVFADNMMWIFVGVQSWGWLGDLLLLGGNNMKTRK